MVGIGVGSDGGCYRFFPDPYRFDKIVDVMMRNDENVPTQLDGS